MDANVFLGRQPVLDRNQHVFGYELLYRSNGQTNAYMHHDGDAATRSVLHASLNVLPLAQVVGNRKAFVNITRQLLVDQTYCVLPRDRAVVELLEDVEPDDDVVAACRELKRAGYLLALDDFVCRPGYRKLLKLADIVKIDFLATDRTQRRWFAQEFRFHRAKLLAEKVETHDDFHEAMKLGYEYFQGYFFCKPEIMAGKEVPAGKQNYLRFMYEVNRPELDFGRIEQVVKREVSLSTKLLKYLNSAAVGVRNRLSSIRQALALLGERGLRKWASLAAMTALAEDKPAELLTTCLVRARFNELMCEKAGLEGRGLEGFLTGLLSTLDALIDQPLEQVLANMPVSEDVREALLGGQTRLGQVHHMALAMEQGEAQRLEVLAAGLGLSAAKVSSVYVEAVRWADQSLAA